MESQLAGVEASGAQKSTAGRLRLQVDQLRQSLLREHVEHQEELLRLGAAGRLALDGQLCIMPAEDAVAYRAANPLKSGSVEIDPAANEQRESAFCKTVLARDKVAVLILGGAHELIDNVPRDCGYIRVEQLAYKRMAK
jgi:hypothetical protein